MNSELTQRALRMLAAWSEAAEAYWYDIPGGNGTGCYGTGYNSWGVQTNQKYLSSMAVLSVMGKDAGIPEEVCSRAGMRALAALRFSLASHKSGSGTCTDGMQWGHTWISSLGVERMMHGIRLLDPVMTDEDRAAVTAMLVSESDWLVQNHPVVGDPEGASGHNHPESNLWNGAVLWRTAVTVPDHPRVPVWIKKAHEFLINAVSIAADADDSTDVAGLPVRSRFRGANFHPHFALDHHDYFNTGYMAICVSNAGMLHFDLKAQGKEIPASLYHHQRDLWQVLRRFIAPDGRLLRAGGDSRVRYAYCQEYLVPSLLFAADALGEAYAPVLLDGQLGMMEIEMAYSGDGSFYGKRTAELKGRSPYYYTRLESDRACVLGMLAAYTPLVAADADAGTTTFETSVGGSWTEPGYGAALVRSEKRFASFTWEAQTRTQGMCLPPGRSAAAEWEYNLSGYVRFRNDKPIEPIGHKRERSLLAQRTEEFPGGFVTSGTVGEGTDATLLEGWKAPSPQAFHQMVFTALPDDRTVIGMQFCVSAPYRTYPKEAKGLHLNLPNDLFNHGKRVLLSANGDIPLTGPAARHEVVRSGGTWLTDRDVGGIAGLYGADELVIDRSPGRRGGKYHSLHTEQVCWPLTEYTDGVDPETVLLDTGWAVLAGADADETREFAGGVRLLPLTGRTAPVRGLRCTGADGNNYLILANFGDARQSLPLVAPLLEQEAVTDLVTGKTSGPDGQVIISLEPAAAHVFRIGS